MKLPDFIFPMHITINHLPREIAADIRQAPCEVTIWGALEGKSNKKFYANTLDSLHISTLNTTGEGPPITGGHRFSGCLRIHGEVTPSRPNFPIQSCCCFVWHVLWCLLFWRSRVTGMQSQHDSIVYAFVVPRFQLDGE